MGAPLNHLSLARWALLGLLDESSQHGFALTKLLGPGGEVGQLWSVPVSAVYRSLEALREAGLVSATAVEPSEIGPQRTVYALTGAGTNYANQVSNNTNFAASARGNAAIAGANSVNALIGQGFAAYGLARGQSSYGGGGGGYGSSGQPGIGLQTPDPMGSYATG